jgi:hypothetical protein
LVRAAPLIALALAGCQDAKQQRTYTLYRNSPMDAGMRVHFASFDARDVGVPGQGSYNLENCQMTADLLNENVGRLNSGKHPAKFWCELGKFKEN